jgi:hypothetical protein
MVEICILSPSSCSVYDAAVSDRTPVRSSVKVLGGIFFLLLSLVALEVISFAALGPLAARGLLYRPQSLDGFEEYISRRDPALGWPAPDAFGGKDHDETGARWSPAFAGQEACVSVYGDSFTFGADVAHEEAWPNRLAERLGCRVSNFGVGGYGSDQALLRFELNETNRAPVVVLGHLTENILRNVNQLRGLLYAGSRWGLKPRWIVGADGRLELVPIPTGSLSELSRVIEAPEDHLTHEFFVPGGESGKQRASFSGVAPLRNLHPTGDVNRQRTSSAELMAVRTIRHLLPT